MGLTLTNVDVIYGGVIQVLRSVNLEVPDGKVVVLLGSNGAGKTTTLRAISGLLHADLGEVTAGKIICRRSRHHQGRSSRHFRPRRGAGAARGARYSST